MAMVGRIVVMTVAAVMVITTITATITESEANHGRRHVRVNGSRRVGDSRRTVRITVSGIAVTVSGIAVSGSRIRIIA